jgi:membrane-bound serine protease (ClpP class)
VFVLREHFCLTVPLDTPTEGSPRFGFPVSLAGTIQMRNFALITIAFILAVFQPSAGAQVINRGNAKRTAVVIPLHEDINPLSGALLERKFQQAIDSGADVIVLDIHSPGGFTYVTFELMDMVLDAKQVETVAFIEKDAISGAALLSLACDRIIMLPDARIGDAGEIVMGADGKFRYTEAKSRSVLAQKVRDTAEARGRPLALAEKMVDKDMVVFESTNKTTGEKKYISNKEWDSLAKPDEWEKGKPVREAGKEMFFIANGKRAVELGFATEVIQNRDQLAEALNARQPMQVMKRTWSDTFVFLLNTGFATFLLIAIGLIALVIEFSAPGISIGGLTSLLCFSLFFWSRFLGGTSGWLEVILFVVGLTFIAIEFFVIPGFGFAGIGGIVLVLGSLVMASSRGFFPETNEELNGLGSNVLTVAGAFLCFIVSLFFLARYIGEMPGLSRLTLKPAIAPPSLGGSTLVARQRNDELPAWQLVDVGDVGTTVSPLRPSGKVQIRDLVVDVVTEGDFVDTGCEICVVAKQGVKVTVRALS